MAIINHIHSMQMSDGKCFLHCIDDGSIWRNRILLKAEEDRSERGRERRVLKNRNANVGNKEERVI